MPPEPVPGPAVPGPPVPGPPVDRYAAAVLARRLELRAERGPLSGSHRAELRTEIALSRGVAAELLDEGLTRLGRAALVHADHPDRAVRRGLPSALTAALTRVVGQSHGRWRAELAPALLRIAGSRGLLLDPGWPQLPAPATPRPPGPAPPRRSWSAAGLDALALWRLALLPLAALPLVGPPAVGSGLAPVAVGTGVAVVVLVVRARRHAAERTASVRWLDTAMARARSGATAEFERSLSRLEHRLAVELDAAVERRRAVVEAALRAVGGA